MFHNLRLHTLWHDHYRNTPRACASRRTASAASWRARRKSCRERAVSAHQSVHARRKQRATPAAAATHGGASRLAPALEAVARVACRARAARADLELCPSVTVSGGARQGPGRVKGPDHSRCKPLLPCARRLVLREGRRARAGRGAWRVGGRRLGQGHGRGVAERVALRRGSDETDEERPVVAVFSHHQERNRLHDGPVTLQMRHVTTAPSRYRCSIFEE